MNRLATKPLSGPVFQPWEWKVCAGAAFYSGGVSVCRGGSLLRASSAPVQPTSAAVPWWRLDKPTSSSHAHPPQSGAYQPRTGPALLPELASSFVPVGASQRLTGWWMAAAESDLEKPLSRVVQTPKELEGGCFGFFFIFFFLLIFESLFKLNQREFTETAFMFPHSADERVF